MCSSGSNWFSTAVSWSKWFLTRSISSNRVSNQFWPVLCRKTKQIDKNWREKNSQKLFCRLQKTLYYITKYSEDKLKTSWLVGEYTFLRLEWKSPNDTAWYSDFWVNASQKMSTNKIYLRFVMKSLTFCDCLMCDSDRHITCHYTAPLWLPLRGLNNTQERGTTIILQDWYALIIAKALDPNQRLSPKILRPCLVSCPMLEGYRGPLINLPTPLC